MESDTRPKILLFGAGSVGTVYLYLLSKTSSVTAVCRSNYDVAIEKGFTINSSIFGQNIHFTPHVVRNCEEAAALNPQPFDYIVITSKAIPGTIPQLIRPAVTTGHTSIVLLQNGVGIEEEYHQAFPDCPLISCVVYLPVTQRPAGVIKHGEVELLEIGSYPSTSTPAHAETFAKLITSAGASANIHDDVQLRRWYKLLVNASWNPITALTLCTDVNFMLSSPIATGWVNDVMLEIADIASTMGYPISKEDVDFQLNRAKVRIPNKGIEPSMLQDVREGRQMEVEAIVGNAIRLGQSKGVKCEKLQALYVLATALNSSIGRKGGSG